MQQVQRSIAAFLVTLTAIVVLAAAPIYADSGTEETDNGSTTTQQSDTTSTTDSTTSDSTDTENHSAESEAVKHEVQLFKEHGQKDLIETRDHKNLKSVAERQKTCANIQNAVNHKLSAFDNSADLYLTRLNSVFTKIQAYQSTNNIQATNYATLVQTVAAKQQAASDAVAALKGLGTTINCSSSDPASMLSEVKVGAASSRDALKAYRTALKDIVVALAQAQGGTDTTTTTTTEAN